MEFPAGEIADSELAGCAGMPLFFRKKFHKTVADLGAVIFGDANARFLHLPQLANQVIARRRDGRNSQGGALPDDDFIQLGHRNIETVAERLLHAANALPPVFQRVGIFQPNLYSQHGDVHTE